MQETQALTELEKARSARSNGNEGMSRVLARRAAGLSIRAYLQERNEALSELSLNKLIKEESVRNLLPPIIHEELDRLCMRVDENYQLPSDMDLIADAQTILNILNGTGE